MQLYPTRPAAHLAIAAVAVCAVGVVSGQAAILGWGGAVLIAVAIARAVTLVSVARIRAAGFEMLWTGSKRTHRAPRGTIVEIEAEVRNRDTLAARYVKLRALSSPNLRVKLEPSAGEVSACGRLKVKVTIETPRVGQHGVYGLALEVRGAPGMFEVPLTFANPYGIEVVPRPFATYLTHGRGSPSYLLAPSGHPGKRRGDGSSLRELREHQPGDPFRRIAWRASARRGRLMVREYEREERDVVWIVLDVSLELWAGLVGRAPLDLMIDQAAALATKYTTRGDRVGLYLFGAQPRVILAPDSGPGHIQKMLQALTTGAGTLDVSRSDLDELDVAVRVIEHLRPLDDRGLADVPRNALDKLAQRADAMRARAPFRVRMPEGKNERDAILRRYLAAFGIDSPPKSSSDRAASGDSLARALSHIAKVKPRPSIVHLLSAAPDPTTQQIVGQAVRRLRRLGTTISWALPNHDPALRAPFSAHDAAREASDATAQVSEDDIVPMNEMPLDAVAPDAAEAVRLRAGVAQRKAEQLLHSFGARVARVRPVQRAPTDEPVAEQPVAEQPAEPTVPPTT